MPERQLLPFCQPRLRSRNKVIPVIQQRPPYFYKTTSIQGRDLYSEEGQYEGGKKHGDWVESTYGSTYEGPYVEGKKHGKWAMLSRDGTVFEGPYVNDKRHGKWVRRSPIAGKKNRVRVSAEIFENGEHVRDEGPWTERIRKKK